MLIISATGLSKFEESQNCLLLGYHAAPGQVLSRSSSKCDTSLDWSLYSTESLLLKALFVLDPVWSWRGLEFILCNISQSWYLQCQHKLWYNWTPHPRLVLLVWHIDFSCMLEWQVLKNLQWKKKYLHGLKSWMKTIHTCYLKRRHSLQYTVLELNQGRPTLV